MYKDYQGISAAGMPYSEDASPYDIGPVPTRKEAHRDIPDLAVGGDAIDGGLVPGVLREVIVDGSVVRHHIVAVVEEEAA